MLTTILINIFTVLGVIFFIGSMQFKKKKDILLVQSFAASFYMISYFLVGAISGGITELLELIKDIVFYNYDKNKKKIPLSLLLLFISLLIIIGIIAYQGIYSIAPLIINLAYFISSYFKNPKYIRITILICAIIWIYYNFTVGTYLIIIGNIFEIISASVSLIRYKEKRHT